MNDKSQNVTICCFLMASFLFSACTPRELFVPTSTPTPTSTTIQTPIPTPTSTPTITKTPIPTSDLRTRNPENSHLYLYVEVGKTWRGASTYCRSRGGHLVTIESASENDFVYKLSRGNTWLGISDEAQEGTWAWVTGEPLTYTNWASGEPDNCANGCGGPPNSEPENYAHFQSKEWHDWGKAEVSFVCEWETSE